MRITRYLSLATVLMCAAQPGVTGASTLSEHANGVLVPYVQHVENEADTVMTLYACAAGRVYWTFFDPNGNHVIDNSFLMTKYDKNTVVFSTELPPNTSLVGSIVFVLDTAGGGSEGDLPDGALGRADEPCLAGTAIHQDVQTGEAYSVPAVPLWTQKSGQDFGRPHRKKYVKDLSNMDEDTIKRLAAGADSYDEVQVPYRIDHGTGGDDTLMVIWSAQDLSGTYTVNVYDDNEDRKSLELMLPNKSLNLIDPDSAPIWPIGFSDGFVLLDLSDSWYLDTARKWNDGVIAFSVIRVGVTTYSELAPVKRGKKPRYK